MADWLQSSEARQLKQSIDWHLANVSDDRSLRDRLEGMGTGAMFKALGWYWAPRLYSRNRAVFRPFIQQYFTEYYTASGSGRGWEHVPWNGEVAAALDPWLAVLEREGEIQLFRRLYGWKHRKERGWGLDAEKWQEDVRERFAASSPAQRAKVLQLFDMHAELDESTAIHLYDTDPGVAGPFILRHLPNRWWGQETKRRLWQQLADRARRAGNEDLYFKLYRLQIPHDDWARETLQLCATISDPETLNQALEQRHPEGHRGLGPQFHKFLETRGLDVLPYVRKHLHRVLAWGGRTGYDELVALAQHRGWTDVWAALVVTCGTSDHYNAALKQLLDDSRLEEDERMRRLLMLSGVSREWNGLGWGLARVQQLTDVVALTMYERYPQLLRQSFKAHVTPAWRANYFKVFELAWKNGDDVVTDYLASRYATRSYMSGKTKEDLGEVVAEKFVALKLDEAAFARRAANVLTLIPAYSIFDYNRLVRENRLARLLFERSLRSFLQVPSAVRDLVEGGEIHVQQLAYRVLGLADPRAEEQAGANLDILIGTVLRPLHRRTRLAAFSALANAASTLQCAQLILAKAREAFALPDERYPKEQLVGLIARILARHPALAGPTEHPVIYRRAG